MQTASSTPSNESKFPKKSTETSSDDKNSTAAHKGDDTKKPANDTDHTTISSSFCGCRKDKCDAFFDKLLCYLEKQSDILAKCCAHNQVHRRESLREPACNALLDQREKPQLPKEQSECNRLSPCKNKISKDRDDQSKYKDNCSKDSYKDNQLASPKPRDTHKPIPHWVSTETLRSKKESILCREEDDPYEDTTSEPLRYKSHDLGGNRPLKLGDRPCNIYVEVCSCQKGHRNAHKSLSRTTKAVSECSKAKQASPQHQARRHSNEYGVDCQGCEKKVGHFFKLAEEICQGYMRQCQGLGPLAHSNFGNQVPSVDQWKEGSNESQRRAEIPHGYNSYEPKIKPITIDIECGGAKEEIQVDPCLCVEMQPDSCHSRPTPAPSRVESHGLKKSCLDTFEERYGQLLRDLHAKLFPEQKPNPQGHPPQGCPPQVYPPMSYPNPYGDAVPNQRPPHPLPPVFLHQQQYPPVIPNHQQSSPGFPQQQQLPYPPLPPPSDLKQDIKPQPKGSNPSEESDSSEERKKPKKKDKKDKKSLFKKNKGSKGS